MGHQRPLSTPEEAWRTYDAMEVRLSAFLSERMLTLAGIDEGMRVLDLATGRGEPAIRAAHRVGPRGSVVGVDTSPTMLAFARARAEREGVDNLQLRTLDLSEPSAALESHFDRALSRWGLMFFNHPAQALVHVGRALTTSGILVAAVWAEPERVSWFSLPRQVLDKHRPVAAPDLEKPGIFYYANQARLERDLRAAGFEPQHTEELEVPVLEASTAEEVIAWVRTFGMTKLLNDAPEEVQRAWAEDFTHVIERRREGGHLRLGGVSRLVVAVKRAAL